MLKGKVVYVVTTEANKSKDVKILLDYLKAEGATCILMPTATSCSIMDLRTVEEYTMKKDYTFGGYYHETIEKNSFSSSYINNVS